MPNPAQPEPDRFTRLCDEGVEMGDHLAPATRVVDSISGKRCLCGECYEREISRAERAEERAFEAYHGGNTPFNDRERS